MCREIEFQGDRVISKMLRGGALRVVSHGYGGSLQGCAARLPCWRRLQAGLQLWGSHRRPSSGRQVSRGCQESWMDLRFMQVLYKNGKIRLALGCVNSLYTYSVGQINDVRGWSRATQAQAAWDKPLILFICPTEYTLRLHVLQVRLWRLRGLRREERPHRHHRGGEDHHRVRGRQWRDHHFHFRWWIRVWIRVRIEIKIQQSLTHYHYFCREAALMFHTQNTW